MDTCSKLVGERTCLNVINDLYNENRDKSKEEKRALIVDHFHNKMVMSNYGQSRCFIVEDVLFDMDVSTYTL